jgi:DNA polymerase-3 subunit gamma/tau
MPYTVFALKWRPNNFDEIIGQNHVVATLKNALDKNRLANAYLFSGPRGVGKTSAARVLAKALNCKSGPTVEPCGKCSSCIEITQGRSLDVIEIDGASNRGIDEIRALRESVKCAPVQGKYKIYIIDEVHQITPDGFNALLKTLEEPPSFVKFIFATTHPHKVIPTILSRCQRLDFRRIPLMDITGQLEKIAGEEKIRTDKEVLFAIARASDGSLRDAESLLDQLVSFSQDDVSLADVVSMLGIVEQEALFALTDKIIKKDALAALALFNDIIESGKDTGVFLSNLIEHFRNLMVAKITSGDSKLIDLPQDICDRLLEQARALGLEEIFSAFNILVNTQEISKRLDSPRIPLEISLVRLAHDKRGNSAVTDSAAAAQAHPEHHRTASQAQAKPAKEEAHKAQNIHKAETPVSGAHKAKEPAIEDCQPSVSLDKIKDSWQNIAESLGRIKMSVATYLNEGSPLKIEHNVLTVAFPKNYSLHKECLEKKENRAIIEKLFCDLFNSHIRINFILDRESAPAEEGQDNPVIKSALEAFRARVIKQ